MGILTTRDSFSILEKELASAEAKAARRGLSLSPEWQGVRDAIDGGRLPGSWAGKQLPTAESIKRLSLAHVQEHFAASADRLAPRVTGQMGELMSTSSKVVGKALVVVDVAGTAYFEYVDVNRYRSGEIGGGYLTFKSTLRASQLSLAYYAAATPEPVTKAVAGVASIVLVVADIASDPIYQYAYQRRKEAAAMVLESVKREERYYAARQQLLSLSPSSP